MLRRKRKRYKAYLNPSNEPSLPRTTQQRIQKANENKARSQLMQSDGNVSNFHELSSTSASAASFSWPSTSSDNYSVNLNEPLSSDDDSCGSISETSEKIHSTISDDLESEKSNLEDTSDDISDSDTFNTNSDLEDDEEANTEDMLYKFLKYKKSKHFQQLNSPVPTPAESLSVFEVLF